MTTPTQHTALPWTVAYGSIYQDEPSLKREQSGIRIAMMDRNEPRTMPTERDANAEYIVRACNSYPDLLEIASLFDWIQENRPNIEWLCIDAEWRVCTPMGCYSEPKLVDALKAARAEQSPASEGKE